MSGRQGQSVERRLIEQSEWDGDCLRWTGPRNYAGYGSIKVKCRCVGAHRAAYEVWIGPIPAGLEIDHVAARGCRFRDCINPAHLEAVTHRENLRRKNPDGPPSNCDFTVHPRTPDNIDSRPDGPDRCRTCRKEWASRRVTCPDCGGDYSYRYLRVHRERAHLNGAAA